MEDPYSGERPQRPMSDAIGCDASAETSWRPLIRGLAATGARSEALCAYLELRSTLVEALGTEPSATS